MKCQQPRKLDTKFPQYPTVFIQIKTLRVTENLSNIPKKILFLKPGK